MRPKHWSTYAIVLAACGLAIYVLQSHRFGNFGAIVTLALAILIGRGLSKGNPALNLFGGQREFSLRPAIVAGIKGLLCFVAAMLWAVGIATAIRSMALPDNAWTAFGLLGAPIVGLIALGALFLGKAIFSAQFGNRK
jgi:hypothetical protein